MNKRLIDQNLVIVEGQNLGDGSTTAVVIKTVEIRCGKTEGLMRFEIRASALNSGNISLAEDAAFLIEILTGETGACAALKNRFLPSFHTTDDAAVAYAPDEIICAFDIPEEFGPYIQAQITHGVDLDGLKIDAILYPVA